MGMTATDNASTWRTHAKQLIDTINVVGTIAWLTTFAYQYGYLLLPLMVSYHITAPIFFLTAIAYQWLQADSSKAFFKALKANRLLTTLAYIVLISSLLRYCIVPLLLQTWALPIWFLLILEKAIMTCLMGASFQVILYPPLNKPSKQPTPKVSPLDFLMNNIMQLLYIFDVILFTFGRQYRDIIKGIEIFSIFIYYHLISAVRPDINQASTFVKPITYALKRPSTYIMPLCILAMHSYTMLPIVLCTYTVICFKHLYETGYELLKHPKETIQAYLVLSNGYLTPATFFGPRYISKNPLCTSISAILGYQFFRKDDHEMETTPEINTPAKA